MVKICFYKLRFNCAIHKPIDNVLEFVEFEGSALLILTQNILYPTTSGLRLGKL